MWFKKEEKQENRVSYVEADKVRACEDCGAMITKEKMFIVSENCYGSSSKNYYCCLHKKPYNVVQHYSYPPTYIKIIPEQTIQVNEDGSPIKAEKKK